MVPERTEGPKRRAHPLTGRADCSFRSGGHSKDIKKELNAQISKEQPRHLRSLLESFDTSDKRLLKVNRQLVVCRKVHDVMSKGGWIMILVYQGFAGAMFTKSSESEFKANLGDIQRHREWVLSKVVRLWPGHPPCLLQKGAPQIVGLCSR